MKRATVSEKVLRTIKRVAGNLTYDTLRLIVVERGREGEAIEREHLKMFLREFEIDCVFDVGANAGQYATLLRRIGFGGVIISFEPIPRLAQQLRRAARNDPAWFVEEAVLSDAVATVTFNVMASDQFSSLNRPSHDQTKLFDAMNVVSETLSVRSSRLDDFFDRYRKQCNFQRPFLKMDTQGSDVAVARGAGDRLQQFVGLQSELAVKCLYEAQLGYREAIDFYERAGFVLSSLVPNNGGHFPDLIEVDAIMYNALHARRPQARSL